MADHATIFYNSKNVQFGEEAASPSTRGSFGNPCYFWICRFTEEVFLFGICKKILISINITTMNKKSVQ